MKKISIFALILIAFFIVGCNELYEFPGMAFESAFESLNQARDKDGKEYYNVSIDQNNPFIVVDDNYIKKIINNKESFYLFIGNPTNYYSRVVLDTLLKSIKDNKIEKVFFVDSANFKEDNELVKSLKIDIAKSALISVKNGKVDKYSLGLKVDKELNEDLTAEESSELLNDYNNVFK